MAARDYISNEHLKELEEEYNYLILTEWNKVSEKLLAAKALGDIAGNKAYEDAKVELNLPMFRIT